MSAVTFSVDDINHLLDTLQEGDPVAADQLLVLVYSELRRLAAAKMAREGRWCVGLKTNQPSS